MRILWVTPYRPNPRGGGGSTHEFELLRWAARHHDVHVITADLPPGVVDLDLGDRTIPIEGVFWRQKRATERRWWFATQLLRSWPSHNMWLAQDRNRVLKRAVARRLEDRPVDLVHFTAAEIAPVAEVCDAPVALLLFDVFSRHFERELELAGPSRARARWVLERWRTRVWERHHFRRVGGVAVVSSVDAATAAQRVGRDVPVIPNPVPDPFYEPPPVDRTDNVVTFVANLAYRPNIDSVEWLTEAIWPRVRERVPDAELVVAGFRPTRAVVEAVARAGGTLHADVDDVRPYYWRAAVALAPVRLGSGLRNKVLHAMACGAPVVATTTALEGLELSDGEQLLVADDAASFANAIVATLDDRAAARRRVKQAFEFVEDFRAEGVWERLEQWWLDVAAPAAGRRRTTAGDAVSTTVEASPAVSVVLCSRDRPDLLRRSLPHVAAAAEMVGAEVLIVEQGQPVAAAICAQTGVEVGVVRDEGVGAARARNLGVRHARGDIILFTDDDCLVPPTWVRDHVDALIASGLPGSDVIGSFGSVEGLSRFEPGPALDPREEFDPASRRARHHRGAPPWLVGHSANMAVCRSAFVDVGGFDERMGPGAPGRIMAEDADLIVRLLHAGGTVTSGVGRPVRHVEWRSAGEDVDNLVAYERGAGAWIGKLARTDRRTAMPYFRERLRLLRDRVRERPGVVHAPKPVLLSIVAFADGFVRGWRLGPWRAGQAAQASGGADREP